MTVATAGAAFAGVDGQLTLSVVLPNYNHGRLIVGAVEALLAQERAPDEIVIVDDGSTDDSLQVIKSQLAGTSSIRVLAVPTNEGMPKAVSRGLAVARGKYVYFAAADDRVLPGFFATALQVLESCPRAGFICGECSLVSGRTGEPLGVRPIVLPSRHTAYFSPAMVVALLKQADNWILTCSAIFVRDHVVRAGGFLSDLGSFADGYMGRRIALTHGFCFVPRLMSTWQIFDDGLSRATAADPRRVDRVLKTALVHFAREPVFPLWYGNLFRRRLQFGVGRLAIAAPTVNWSVLIQVTTRSRADHIFLSVLSHLPTLRPLRWILLAWLWLRLWPMSLTLVLRSMLWRHFALTSG